MAEQEAVENLLKDLGVTELMEQKVKDAGLSQTTETTPEATTTTTEATPAATEPAAVVTPEVAETTPQKEDIWKDIIPATETPKEIDYKAQFEKTQVEFNSLKDKIEKHKPLKDLADLIDSPDFDLEKFFEVNTKKTIDFTQFPVENLYKQSLAEDQIAGYTPDEIEAMWEKKKLELEEDPTMTKTLKSQLVREFQAKQPAVSADEPEIIKAWKEAKQNQQVQIEKMRTEQADLTNSINQFAKEVVGKKVGDIEVTKDHSAKLQEMMNPEYYRTKDEKGHLKFNDTMLKQEKLKAVLFDDMVQYYRTLNKTEAKIEARKEITRPNKNESGGSQVVNVDDRDEATKIIEQGMTSMGLQTDLVIKK